MTINEQLAEMQGEAWWPEHLDRSPNGIADACADTWWFDSDDAILTDAIAHAILNNAMEDELLKRHEIIALFKPHYAEKNADYTVKCTDMMHYAPTKTEALLAAIKGEK